MKKVGYGLLAALILVTFGGCSTGDSFFQRGWKHIEWHILGAYKDLVNLHKDIDKYIFNLDERNPDRY